MTRSILIQHSTPLLTHPTIWAATSPVVVSGSVDLPVLTITTENRTVMLAVIVASYSLVRVETVTVP